MPNKEKHGFVKYFGTDFRVHPASCYLDFREVLLQGGDGLLALAHSVGVLGAGQLVLHVRVGHQDDGYIRPGAVGHESVVVGAAVDQQQIALLAHRTDVL